MNVNILMQKVAKIISFFSRMIQQEIIYIKKFIGEIKEFIDFKEIKDVIDKSLITGILFITATPIEKFWKMLNDSGIKRLLNMNFNKPYLL